MVLSGGSFWWALHASLAQIDGRRKLPGLTAPVQIERDHLGVPTIHATNRLDATRALGFLHAQDRFFQMDLSRRVGSGELSELFGTSTLDHDRQQRIHRPRVRAKRALEQTAPEEVAVLKAYAEGVNAGLDALRVRPPEYLALRAAPRHWELEDTLLVAYAMFAELHDTEGWSDYHQSVLRRALSPAARAFFDSPDTRWSAALDGSELPSLSIPQPEDFSVQTTNSQVRAVSASAGLTAKQGAVPESSKDLETEGIIGSNNWAVDGRRSGTGAAIVANDMHLGLRVPNTWYRARLLYHHPQLGSQDVTGVTLPGTPVVVSGSNRYIAWGNTASCLDVTDLVELEFDPAKPRRYRTPSGWRELEPATELVQVRNRTNAVIEVTETIWGPVVTRGQKRYALACTIHDPQAVNMGLVEVENARDVESALRTANLSGTPVNNFVVGDRVGHIGYSLLGRLPNRAGFDGVVPCSWADGTRGWQGWLPPERYPRVLDPTNGVLWTANNRILGGPEYAVLHCDPDNGARARQIRDDLLALDRPSEQSLWSLYRDDRALFLEPWQKLMLSTLDAGSATNANWRTASNLVASWGGRAAVDSQGFRLVRAFRDRTLELLFEPVNQKLARVDSAMRIRNEDAAWAMLTARPTHLLNPKFGTYDRLLEEAANRPLAELKNRGIALTNATWGARNRLGIRHPLSSDVPPWLARWLDMPDVAVSGDSHMPKVHAAGFGVSERMIVSPGHEENGLFNMPCGQSGHFLSPFYRSEMDAWLKITPEPFLPGTPEHVLSLGIKGRRG
jgi:penicillin amidase